MKHILLATHGTPGAQKAEQLAARWARDYGAEVHILSIANEAWKDMTGDDWLNTSTTRNKFGDYVEGQINAEMDALQQRVAQVFDGLPVYWLRRAGKLEDVLARTAEEVGADVLIIGAWQKNQAPGFRDRVQNRHLHPQLPCPVVVAP